MNDPDFFRKIRLRHFVSFIVLQLHAKFRKDPMTGLREKPVTNGRTNKRQQIYRTNLRSRWVQKDIQNWLHIEEKTLHSILGNIGHFSFLI